METCEITIQRQAGETWPVIVEQRASGVFLPLRHEGVLHLDLEALRSQMTPRDYGLHLGRALFRDDVRDAFVAACASSTEVLRLLLFVEDAALKTLRWERLCAPFEAHWDFVALDQRVAFSLYLPSLTDRRFPPIGRRDLRALVLVANPDGLATYHLAPFDVQTAVDSVCTALGEIPSDVLATVAGTVGPPTLDALCERLTAQPYTLLHVICHGQYRRGDGETVLYLARADGQVDAVVAGRVLERLGRLHGAHGLPHLAFLATCESAVPEAEGALGGLAQRLVRELGMPAVVAMTERVSVVTAQALAAGLYHRLRQHGEVDRALVEASAALTERYDITVPALYSRLGGRPLFSDALDRPLTAAEIRFGLDRLETLLEPRAPVLQRAFQALAAQLRGTLGAEVAALSQAVRQERTQALDEINGLCGEALDLSFNALALGAEPPAYEARCPFRGLYPFRLDDQEFFFGREPLVAQLQHKLADHPFLAVLGPSGSGKSSLVLAGLLPALQTKEPALQVAYMTPGSTPLMALEAALARVQGRRAVLVVDQGEELFTLCTDTAQRQAYLDRLLSLPGRFLVVLTLRADFWGECAPYPALKEAMQAHQELIAPMQTAELRRAMELQAAKVGLRFEADLSHTILDDAQGEPGAMPLLQHALLELWKHRRGRWLRAEEYRALGGVPQAMARTADAVYDQLASEERERMRDIFLRLTRLDVDAVPGESRRDTRQRVGLAELLPAGSDAAMTRALVARLADARLVVTSVHEATGREEVEVAHEALIRYWPRLGAWLDEDRVGLRLREGIRAAALDWDAGQREESLLVHRGGRLQEAVALSGRPRFALNALEQAYLDAGVALRQREQADADAQRQRELEAARQLAEEQRQRADLQTRAARRLRVVVGGLVMVFLLAVGAALWASQAQQRAQANARVAQTNATEALAARARATRQARLALAQRLAVQARQQAQEHRLDLGLLLSLAAHHLAPGGAAQSALLDTLQSNRHLAAFWPHQAGQVGSLAFSPPGNLLAIGSAETIVLRDMATGQPLGPPLLGHSDVVQSLAFSPDGTLLASSSADDLVLWDAPTRQLLSRVVLHNGSAGDSLAFSPDGRLLAFDHGNDVLLWDVATRQALDQPLGGHTTQVSTVAFHPGGRLVAAGSWDGRILVWDVATRQPIAPPLMEHAEHVDCVLFSPDGTLLASGGPDGIVLWDVATWQPLGRHLPGHPVGARGLAFSPDSRLLAAGNTALDKRIILWDVQQRQPLAPQLVGHTSWTNLSLAFSPDGTTLASSAGDATVILWQVAASPRLAQTLTGHTDGVQSLVFSPDGAVLASSGCGGRRADGVCQQGEIRLWDMATRQPRGVPLTGHAASVWQVAFHAAGLTLVSVSCGSSEEGACHGIDLRQWEVSSGRPVDTPQPTEVMPHVESLTLSPDGSTVAAGGCHQSAATCHQAALQVWSVLTGQPLKPPLDGQPTGVLSLALSPNGATVASSSLDNVLLWNLAHGQARGVAFPGRRAVFSPDGTMLASVSVTPDNLTINLHDALTGQLLGAPLPTQINVVWALAFSSDNRLLAVSGTDFLHPEASAITLWDLATRQPLGQFLLGWKARVFSLAFSPDSQTLAAGSEDGVILLWDVSVPSWQARACHLVQRNFTAAEWQHYLGEHSYEPPCPTLPRLHRVPETGWGVEKAGDLDGAIQLARYALTGAADGHVAAPVSEALSPLSSLIFDGWNLAAAGKVDKASILFHQARALSPDLDLDPVGEAQRLAAPSRVAKGQRLATQGLIPEALSAYEEAQRFDPAFSIAASAWQTLCWYGSVGGQAATVMPACEQAVARAPDSALGRTSRGLARSLTGDLAGALADLQVGLAAPDAPLYAQQQRWLAALRAGTNPFTPEELTRLRRD